MANTNMSNLVWISLAMDGRQCKAGLKAEAAKLQQHLILLLSQTTVATVIAITISYYQFHYYYCLEVLLHSVVDISFS